MIPEIYKEILDRLHIKSQNGEANWRTTGRDNQYIIYFQKFSLSIIYGYEESDNSCYILLSIYNENGESIDSFYVDDNSKEEYEFLEKLYQSAKRKALKIDEAVSEMLLEVNKKGIIGADKILTNEDDEIKF